MTCTEYVRKDERKRERDRKRGCVRVSERDRQRARETKEIQYKLKKAKQILISFLLLYYIVRYWNIT